MSVKNMIKIFTLSEILGRCVIYLEENMLNDFTLLFTLKTQICLAELMHITTEKKIIVPLALAFGMSYIIWEYFFLHAKLLLQPELFELLIQFYKYWLILLSRVVLSWVTVVLYSNQQITSSINTACKNSWFIYTCYENMAYYLSFRMTYIYVCANVIMK